MPVSFPSIFGAFPPPPRLLAKTGQWIKPLPLEATLTTPLVPPGGLMPPPPEPPVLAPWAREGPHGNAYVGGRNRSTEPEPPLGIERAIPPRRTPPTAENQPSTCVPPNAHCGNDANSSAITGTTWLDPNLPGSPTAAHTPWAPDSGLAELAQGEPALADAIHENNKDAIPSIKQPKMHRHLGGA